MMARRSVRAFTGEPVTDEHLQQILQAAQQAPNSINAQQISLVVTRDRDTLGKIADIAGGQPQVRNAALFITVVVDFNRTAIACENVGEPQQIEQTVEGLVVGAVDAGIMLAALETAAVSLGYGCTAIGGIRRDPLALARLLELPARTFPINGMAIGVPDPAKPAKVKPRVPLSSFAMMERYDAQAVADGVTRYEVTLRQWWDEQDLQHFPGYSQGVANFYKPQDHWPVRDALLKQGFDFDK